MKYRVLVESATSEKEVRDLFEKARDAKYNPKIFGVVVEIIEKREFLRNKKKNGTDNLSVPFLNELEKNL